MSTRWLAAAGAALLAAACAQSTGDINRVQPNVIKKSDLLDGTWYFRNTVTKTPATTGFTFTGETGNIEKVVWDIEMESLIGYRAYPFIPGSESNIDLSSIPSGTTAKVCDEQGKCRGGQRYYGAPLVRYPIRSHFDIQRSYSTSTAEQGNVISENASDRVWNQREYIRVDWSANLLNMNSGMSWGTLQNPAGGSSGSSWIQPNEPGTDPYDWPTLEYGADGKLKYMDFTGRYWARPEIVYIEDYGYYPLCYFRGGHRYDCTSQQIHMRTSIWKVDPNVTNDYEPLVYGNDLMTKFGYFRTERLNYDRKFGTTESARIFLANRHRIFKGAFEKNAEGKPDPTRPIPFASRKLRPVVYYLSPADRMGHSDIYDTYKEAAKILETNWDVAFRRAAAAAQGKDPSEVGQMLYVCENPVPAGAPAACGPQGFEAKLGDVRYSFVYTITDPVPNGLLGYGPSSADPETGEIISANANTYSAAVDSVAQSILDTMNVLVGDKTIDNIIRGDDVKEYMANRANYAGGYKAQKSGPLQAELQGIPQTNLPSQGAFDKPTARLSAVLEGAKVRGGLPQYTADRARLAADLLEKNPALESVILDNPDVQNDVLGLLPAPLATQAEVDPAFKRRASREVLTRMTSALDFEKQRIEWASRRNIYLAEFMDREVMGLALRENAKRAARIAELVAQGHASCANTYSCTATEARRLADEEVRRRLRQSVWRATSEHEFGHTVGLRHNFQGSFDAVNYFNDYWKIKQESLTVSQNGQPKVPRTPADLMTASDGTETQIARGMNDYEYSSIMDYSGKRNGDFYGIGKYDEAAIIFAYSGGSEPGYVEVFESARATPQTFPGSDGNQLTLNGAAYDLPLVNAQHKHQGVPNFTERFHYSTVPLRFGQGADLESTIADGITKLSRRKLMKWSEVKKANQQVEALLKNNPNPTAGELGNVPLEVPYMFCTDDHVGSVLSCQRFDRGPDYYEVARTKIQDYWNGYYFTHFKRDRYVFTSSRAFNNAAITYLDLSDIYKHWVFAFYGQAGTDQQALPKYQYDPLMQDTWTMAVLDGANNHLGVMSVPPAGFFMYRDFGNGDGQWDLLSEGVDFDDLLPEGQQIIEDYYTSNYGASSFAHLRRGFARRMYSRYDFKSGFGFWDRMLEAGHYNDQMGAMIAAVLPQATFLGVDDIADFRRYSIPYYLVFKQEFGDTFGQLWGYDEGSIRPNMFLTLDEAGKVSKTSAVQFKRYIAGENYVQGFAYPRYQPVCNQGITQNCFKTEQLVAPVNIQLTWTSRIYALWLGMALFSVNYDLDFAKQNQVFKLGSQEQVQVAPGYHAVEVADVTTGHRYVAIEKDGSSGMSTPALRLIRIADAYRQVVEDPAICPMPRIPNSFGGPGDTVGDCMPADQRSNPYLVEQRRKEYTEYFKDTIRDLDLMRGFYDIFGRAF
ncbi:MAG: hypothetical protein ACOZIN_22320 [Myxococcota bacterium]